jgi:hypothetical protein
LAQRDDATVNEPLRIVTLADVRELMRHLPEENRSKAPWRYVASQLNKAANGILDTVEVEIALRLVLMLEGVKCRPR